MTTWNKIFLSMNILLFFFYITHTCTVKVEDERASVSFYKLQQYLQQEGHELSADGILGPETQRAWEEQIWNQENKEFNK